MRTILLIVAGALALASLPAAAHGFAGPRFGLELGYGYPFHYGSYFYDPWFYPYAYAPYRERDTSDATAPANLYVYPKAGQTEEQIGLDRTACHDWAVGQTGFDPSTTKRRKLDERADYNRAYIACLEGRNYSVG